MTKPRLDESAMSDEMGAVASFATPPVDRVPNPPPALDPPGHVPDVAGNALPDGEPLPPQPSTTLTAQQPTGRSTDRAIDRTTGRYAFEFYTDQITELRRLSLEEKARGDPGNMSEMVRNAVDTYIETRRRR